MSAVAVANPVPASSTLTPSFSPSAQKVEQASNNAQVRPRPKELGNQGWLLKRDIQEARLQEFALAAPSLRKVSNHVVLSHGWRLSEGLA